MFNKIVAYTQKPKLYAGSTAKFWNDAHISKGMLEAHLNPDGDAATRKLEFVSKSVDWITVIAPPADYPRLLDLGCGPGIYAEKFYEKTYMVTGIDLSGRSIGYARTSAKSKSYDINYLNLDYMGLNHKNEFDVVTLIYCDFAVFSDENRKMLLEKIQAALKPGGKLIFDVFTPEFYERMAETKSWDYCDTGFWNEKPHICLYSFYRYDEASTVLDQNMIITENTVHCYNLWKHTFTAGELQEDLNQAGFSDIVFYGDVAGAEYKPDGDVICTVAKKEMN